MTPDYPITQILLYHRACFCVDSHYLGPKIQPATEATARDFKIKALQPLSPGSVAKMAASFLLLEGCHWCTSTQIIIGRHHKSLSKHRLQLRKPLITWESHQETSFSRRHAVLLCSGISLVSALTLSCVPVKAAAEEMSQKSQEDEEGETGVVGAIKSLFDPNEKTKSGKLLPKAYLKAAREVVKTLRESLEEDSKDVAKFRRSADAAKESIRDYLNGWRGQQAISKEESYVALEKAIRSLANFYSKAGPFAALSEEVKTSILDDLNTAEAYL